MKFFGLALFFVVLLFPVATRAQTTTLSVAPAIIEVASQRGEKVSQVLTIRNGDSDPVPVDIEIQSLLRVSELQVARDPYDAKTWLSLDKESLVLAGNSLEKVALEIHVPDNASPGGHYAQLSVRGLSLQTQTTASVVIPELIVGVYITVAGDIQESFEVESSSVAPLRTGAGEQITSNVSIKNTGNVHNLVSPTLTLFKNNQRVVSYMAEPYAVLPESSKEFEIIWKAPLERGEYEVQLEASYGSPRVTLIDQQQNLYVTHHPLLIILSMLVGLVVVYVIEHRKYLKAAYRVLLRGA